MFRLTSKVWSQLATLNVNFVSTKKLYDFRKSFSASVEIDISWDFCYNTHEVLTETMFILKVADLDQTL